MLVNLTVEAESGRLSSSIWTDACLSKGEESPLIGYIAPRFAGTGTADYTVEVPEAGSYVLWAHLLLPGDVNDAFNVSVDSGPSHVLKVDASLSGVNNWHWVRLGDGDGGLKAGITSSVLETTNPNWFTFEAGPHRIQFAGAAAWVWLDKFILSNDRGFVPVEDLIQVSQSETSLRLGSFIKPDDRNLISIDDAIVPPAPVISKVQIGADGARVTWDCVPGAVYRLLCKDTLADAAWLRASPDLVATEPTLSWLDQTSGVSSERYYSVLLVRD
jgi:hypothetical protein